MENCIIYYNNTWRLTLLVIFILDRASISHAVNSCFLDFVLLQMMFHKQFIAVQWECSLSQAHNLKWCLLPWHDLVVSIFPCQVIPVWGFILPIYPCCSFTDNSHKSAAPAVSTATYHAWACLSQPSLIYTASLLWMVLISMRTVMQDWGAVTSKHSFPPVNPPNCQRTQSPSHCCYGFWHEQTVWNSILQIERLVPFWVSICDEMAPSSVI